MDRTTIYCAQPFWHRQGRLMPGIVHEFCTEERALEGGEILSASADGVAVFSLSGEPALDLWGEPVMLATYGRVPDAGAEPWDADAA